MYEECLQSDIEELRSFCLLKGDDGALRNFDGEVSKQKVDQLSKCDNSLSESVIISNSLNERTRY